MDAMESTLQIMKKGDEQIKLSPKRDLIVLLGLTGAGKSTVAALLTSDNSKMTSVKIAPAVYIIQDNKNKISSSKSVFTSHTSLPDMMIDKTTGAVYYDFPGFKDSRNSSVEIASAFFMKKVLNHAEKIKLVFVVDHKTVSQTSSRTEFPDLLRHATNLIKNVDKFIDSIGVIFTKVHNEYELINEVPTLIDDETTIETVARFLETSIADGGGILNEKMKKLVNVILTKQNNKYSRISLFRVPGQAGPLSTIGSAQKAKDTTNQMIHHGLKFTPSNGDDFGYTISPKAQLHLIEMWKDITHNLDQSLTYSMGKIKQHFKHEEERGLNAEALRKKYHEATGVLANLVRSPKTSTGLIELLKNTEKFIKDCDIKDTNLNIDQLGKNMEVITVIAPKQNITESFPSFTRPIEAIHQHFIELESWFTWLITLNGVTSGQSIPQPKYNAMRAKLASLLRGETSTTGHDLSEFMSRILPKTFGHGRMKDVIIDSVRARILNEQLKFVTSSPTSECISGDKLRITALDMKLSDALAVPQCPRGTKFMEILVGKKLFIDADVNKTGSNLNLVIVAPKWEVLGRRVIRLDGYNGPARSQSRAASGSSGTVGRIGKTLFAEGGHDGTDGLPGLPGGNGGNFYGLADEILNGGDLKITVDGGNGGPGQSGGNGGDGADANEDRLHLSQARVVLGCIALLSCVADKDEIVGGEGGLGGRGGIKGLGGHAGNIRVVSKKPSYHKISMRDGEIGADGLGGIGGLSGQNSRYGMTTLWHQGFTAEKHLEQNSPSRARYTKTGVNNEGRQYPPSKSNPDFGDVLGVYKNYVNKIDKEYGSLKISTTWTENRGRRDTRGIDPIGSNHVYSSLHLMDLLVRKCSKVKLPRFHTATHNDDSQFIDPVIVTTKFKDLVNELGNEQGKPNYEDDFDPIAMIEELRELMQKNRYEDICKILYTRLEEFGLSSTTSPDSLRDRVVKLFKN